MRKNLCKKVLALALSVCMILGAVPGSPANPIAADAAEVPSLASISKQVAAEGTVLLKNDNNVLPLAGKTVAVFGRTQNNTQWTGYGSGGYVTSSYKTNLIDYLRQNPKVTIDEELAKVYADWVRNNPGYEGNDWRNAAHSNPEMPLTTEQVRAASERSEVAVVIIGRRWGEGRDLRMGAEDGSYYLTSIEKDMLAKVNAEFENIVVVFNTASVMDMSWVANNTYGNVDSYVLGWLGGTVAGQALAEILVGDSVPSGKLPVTIMDSIEYDETNANYGSGNTYNNSYSNYQEDIYLGYRYTETFGDDHVLYPFGYGLSYTTFKTVTDQVWVEKSVDGNVKNDVIKVRATVTNTGDTYSGKEVVQVYYGAPQGELGKPTKSLAAYAKTNPLRPGESQTMTLSFPVENMASYDDAGKTAYKYAYVLEAGEYPIYVGNDVASSTEAYTYNINSLTLVEQLEQVQAPVTDFTRVVPKEQNGELVVSYENVPKSTRDLDDRIAANLPKEIAHTGNQGITLMDVYNEEKTIEEFVAQLTTDQVASLCRGVGGMGDGSGLPGNASAFGAANDTLRNTYGIPTMSTCDGPSGIRHSGNSTVVPSGIMIGSTWNDELIEVLCAELGKECIATTGTNNRGVDVLLAPGMNIIRNPRCGRNYEYFSEDPLLTGRLAAAYVKGLQQVGVSADVKHYAAYNQGQGNVDSRMSERCLREIYLKPFEIAVKESNPYTVMDSNGAINGEKAYISYDLNTTLLRKEWGWDGMVMTDWGPGSSSYTGDRGTLENMAAMVQAQVDCCMPGHTYNTSTLTNAINANGGITLAEAQQSAINVLNYSMKSMKFARDNGLEFYTYEEPEYERFVVEAERPETPYLNAIYLDGSKVSNFAPDVFDYVLFTNDLANVPTVTADAPAGVEMTVETTGNVTLIRASVPGAETVYRVVFTNQAGLHPTVDNPKYAYLSKLSVNGAEIPGFYPTDYNYAVQIDGPMESAKITWEAAENVTVTTRIDKDANAIIVRSETEHQALEYYITCAAAPQSDNFDGTTLKDFWTIHEQNNNYSKQNGYVQIKSEVGYFNMSAVDNIAAKNIISQPAGGDWTGVTHITFDKLPTKENQAIGIIISDGYDRDNFIFYRMEYTRSNGKPEVRVSGEVNGSASAITEYRERNYVIDQGVTDTIYLKVVKSGSSYALSVSKDGNTYTNIGTVEADFGNPTFSLATYNNKEVDDSITVRYQDVTFDVVEQEVTQMPDPVKITRIGTTQLHLANDAYYTYNLQTEASSGGEAGNINLSHIATDSYALYNIEVEKSGYYDVSPRFASNVSTTSFDQFDFGFEVDGVPSVTWTVLGGTGGWQNWKTLEPSQLYLTAGTHKLKLYFVTDGMNLCWANFTYVSDATNFGDVNLDGSRDIKDISTLKTYILSDAQLTEEQLEAADISLDGKITVLDIMKLKTYLANGFPE